MPLSGEEITEYLKKGKLSINPILDEEEQIQATKVDLRLDNVFHRIQSEQSTYRDTLFHDYNHLDEIEVPYADIISRNQRSTQHRPSRDIHDGFVLHPDEFVLGQTFEYVDLPNNLRGLLTGRSSMGREGVIVHSTAALIDPGYTGPITFELSTNGNLPVVLYPRQRIAAIEFEEIDGEAEEQESRFGDIRDPSPNQQEIEDRNILSTEI